MTELQTSPKQNQVPRERLVPEDLTSNLDALFKQWPTLARELDLVSALNQETPQ